MFHDFMFGGMWFGWIFWIVVIVLIIWLVVNQSNKNKQIYQPPRAGDSAIEILKRRYAKGEITKEEFEQMKKDLE